MHIGERGKCSRCGNETIRVCDICLMAHKQLKYVCFEHSFEYGILMNEQPISLCAPCEAERVQLYVLHSAAEAPQGQEVE